MVKEKKAWRGDRGNQTQTALSDSGEGVVNRNHPGASVRKARERTVKRRKKTVEKKLGMSNHHDKVEGPMENFYCTGGESTGECPGWQKRSSPECPTKGLVFEKARRGVKKKKKKTRKRGDIHGPRSPRRKSAPSEGEAPESCLVEKHQQKWLSNWKGLEAEKARGPWKRQGGGPIRKVHEKTRNFAKHLNLNN